MATSDFPTDPGLPAEILRDALQLLPGPVVCVDGEGIATLCNEAAAALLGYPAPSGLVGRDLHEALHGGNREEGECPLRQAIRGGRRIHAAACTLQGADGSPVPVEVEAVPLSDGAGALLAFADLASRRRLEEDLSARIAARIEAMRGTLHGLTHDMNTPVQFLSINLGFLRHAFGTFDRFMATAQAFAAEAPDAAQAELSRLEAEMDLEFLRAEVPKVFAECAEGLGKVSRIATAMGDVRTAAGESRKGAREGAANAG